MDWKHEEDNSIPIKVDKAITVILPTFREFRVLWLRLYCLNPNSDLVQSIALRKAVETDVTVYLPMLFDGE